MSHTHLSTEERCHITHLHMAGYSNAHIARRIGRHRGTITRELNRNRDDLGQYHYQPAQRLADQRRTHANQRYKLDDTELDEAVEDALCDTWSPQQIADRFKLKHPRNRAWHISHEAIYQWIYRRHEQGDSWYKLLRKPRKRRRPRHPGHPGG